MKEVIIPMDDDEEDITPTKKSKNDEIYKKKAEELEKKLAAIQKNKTVEKERPTPVGKNPLISAFSGITKKIPLETPEGKTIESKNPSKTVNFGTWDFPSLKLLNNIEHQNVVSASEIEEKSILIQKTFLQFGIDVEMEDECVGPTVIQYRLRPSE